MMTTEDAWKLMNAYRTGITWTAEHVTAVRLLIDEDLDHFERVWSGKGNSWACNCMIYSQAPHPDNWLFRDNQGKSISIKVNGNLRSDTGNILMNAVLNGNGVFIGPTFMIVSALKEGRLETVLDEYTPVNTGLYAVYPYSKFVSTKVRAFVDFIAESWSD